ncbi:DNA polymerase IV [Phaeocystidibacter marisrubri]|uniref:DNA polymerase IV n=1 Tax=Phaeocystidibacter marisrubri TaxID=1577780 RepID=A0A6L3ZIV2_9FLAO|nr:DNA polymerase IV [Phaeocystidibacter marisrubri]KAB2817946.1 DNA polymerase IV [Phaeocystidibacter marisrubri]GGH72735.1 DNA polymerase IV 2 [Phaeocystidibacter marisrubri]
MEEKPIRKIIHVDMDAFYASVEQRDRPELRGKPVAVGGSAERGVVAAASYEARKYGVRSAMPSSIAARRCPELIFVKPDFDKYKAVSQQIRDIFLDYTSRVEPLSLDEAFLDVTTNHKGMTSATLIAQEIRQRIFETTQLRASAGISINKFLAKVASDINKPNGQKTIPPKEVDAFLMQLPIEKFFGVGVKTAEKFHQMNVYRGADLMEVDLMILKSRFGKSGQHYYNIVRGIQHSEVVPNRVRKSVGVEETFSTDLLSEESMLAALYKLGERCEHRLKRAHSKGKTITLKLKNSSFEVQTRSHTLPEVTNDIDVIMETVVALLQQSVPADPIRLLGITVSNFDVEEREVQLTLEF